MSGAADGPRIPAGDSIGAVGAIYLHVPFCARRCAYCDFTSSTPHGDFWERAERYGRALSGLVVEASGLGLLEGLRTVYVGGGTPTLLGEGLPRLIASVVSTVAATLDEFTFEANPESSSPALFAACREAGASRVSIGVQSTDDGVLGRLGRLHDARGALAAIGWAREAGLRVSADLMAGVPGQRPGSLRADVARVVDAGADHVSVYALEVHGSTPFGVLEARGELDVPDEDEVADLLEEAECALGVAGLERYEVSNYARPGEWSRHNLAYWTGVPYLGLGPSAASMLAVDAYRLLRSVHPRLPEPPSDVARVRLTCESSIDEIAAARSLADLDLSVEGLTERQAVAEDLMLAARLAEGIAPGLAERARAVIGAAYDAAVERLAEDGLLVDRGGHLRPTGRGWLLGNALSGALWDLAGDADPWSRPA